ncbi:hypothetical protein MTR_5g089450 [Medicago truncatula]|uniref:Uncharacterized protein n=1 Tax=Medicago truncatula TaxID=3880 RepID=G7K332_MEDTR|nr:hypothetical protein MTR_5g089450 [Medicago truncatula]
MISFEEDVHKLEQLYAFTIIKSTLEDYRNVFERKVYIRLEDNFDILKDSKPLDLRPGWAVGSGEVTRRVWPWLSWSLNGGIRMRQGEDIKGGMVVGDMINFDWSSGETRNFTYSLYAPYSTTVLFSFFENGPFTQAPSDELGNDYEEAVSVEWVDKSLSLTFKCPCGKGYEHQGDGTWLVCLAGWAVGYTMLACPLQVESWAMGFGRRLRSPGH